MDFVHATMAFLRCTITLVLGCQCPGVILPVMLQVGAWINAFTVEQGRKPTLQDASAADPLLYRNFLRYLALRDIVRSL